MQKRIYPLVLLFGLFLFAETSLTSCTGTNHCPAVAGTGNSASSRGHAKKKYCAGVSGTGTIKPKRKNVIEEGNFDPKMAKAMAKAQKAKAKKIDKKTLSAD